jgi:hypothetical protein
MGDVKSRHGPAKNADQTGDRAQVAGPFWGVIAAQFKPPEQ